MAFTYGGAHRQGICTLHDRLLVVDHYDSVTSLGAGYFQMVSFRYIGYIAIECKLQIRF